MSVYYFAWVDAGDSTFIEDYKREDLKVFSFELSHVEGEVPSLSVVAINPREGLINPGRHRWAWFSRGDAPLFFGRIVGIPTDPEGDLVKLDFVARPDDFNDRKLAVAAVLKVLPYWDPVFVDESRRADPDSAFDARPEAWHVDRVSLNVTSSHMITGEDGTLDVAGDYFPDSLSITYGQVPGRKIHMVADVSWDQKATGRVDLTKLLLVNAVRDGSGDGFHIKSYTGLGLANVWPKPKDDIGSGWVFGHSLVRRGDRLWVPNPDDIVVAVNNGTHVVVPEWNFRPVLFVKYDAERTLTETVEFTIEADVQELVTEAGDEEVMEVSISSSDVAEPIDPGNVLPIGYQRKRTYFKSPRGHLSVEFLIAMCRAQLLARARTVTVSFEMPIDQGLDLSCRWNIRIADPRLPGGEVVGKVIGYVLSCDGDTGQELARVTLGSTIGNGATVSGVGGDPDWVSDDWVDPDADSSGDYWQSRTGYLIMPIAGEVTYADFVDQPINDDGVDFDRMTARRVVKWLRIIDGSSVQKAVINLANTYHDAQAVIDALKQVFTEIDLNLVPLDTGPFETTYQITTSLLMVPKMIDLSAESTA